MPAKLAGRLGPAALTIHRLFESLAVYAQAFFPGDIGGQVQRKTVGIIQLEHGVTGNLRAIEPGNHCFQQAHSLAQRLGETPFFLEQHFLDV